MMQAHKKITNAPNASYDRIDSRLEKIPADIRGALAPNQVERLLPLLAASRANHTLAFRVSTRFGDQGYYFAFLCGTEKRSAKRLEIEGQRRSWKGLVAKATAASIFYSTFVMSLVLVVPVLFFIITYIFDIELFPAG